jgi:hypothetical protein
MSDIVVRLRDPMKDFDFADRLIAAHEIERLRQAVIKAVIHDEGSTEDPLAKARLKIEQQAKRIDELEAEVALLREVLAGSKK